MTVVFSLMIRYDLQFLHFSVQLQTVQKYNRTKLHRTKILNPKNSSLNENKLLEVCYRCEAII